MTEPTDGVPEGRVPDSGDTQHLPSPSTQALPVTGGYSYPGATSGSASAPVPAVPGATADASTGLAGVSLSDDPGRPRSKRTGLLIGGIAAVAVLAGGGVVATNLLSGSGARPADVLPGDSYAYMQVDIDPSAGQKIAAVRFLSKIPEVKDTLGSDDMRKKLWDSISKDNACISKVNYDNDIAPWLGDRAGLAMRPGGTKETPNMAIALQVKDESKAQATLTKLFACDKGSTDGGTSTGTDLRMRNGYAIITPAGQGDPTIAAVNKGALSNNATFTADMAALGEQGVAAAWFDLAPTAKEFTNLAGDFMGTQGLPTASTADVKGRVAFALRFDPSYVEVAGIAHGIDGIKKSNTNGNELANLPQDTVGAIQISGAGEALDAAWPQLVKVIKDQAAQSGEDDPIGAIEQQFDVKLPSDLKVLLGKSLTIAVPDQKFGDDAPTFGAKAVTTDVKRAEALLTKIEEAAGGDLQLAKKVEGDKVAVATTQDYADQLIAGGKLGDSDTFKAAVGDTSSTNVALYVDLDKIEKQYLGSVGGDSKAFVEALRAVGVNSSTTADGEQTFSFRLVGN